MHRINPQQTQYTTTMGQILVDKMKNSEKSSKPLRYVVAHLYNDYSGSPRVLADFCKSEGVRSASLSIVTSSSKGFLDDDLGEKINVWYPRGKIRLLNYLSFVSAQIQLFLLSVFLVMRGWLRGERVVLVNNTILSLGSMLASKCTNTLNICYVHEINSGPRIVRPIAEFIIKWTADHVIFVSQFVAEDYNLGVKSTVVLPNGLRSDFDSPPVLDYELKFNQQTILFAGSLKKYKGVSELLDIAAALPDTEFVGVFNTSKFILEEFITRESIPPNLNLLAHQANMQDLYRDAFLVLNLSRPEEWIETFGLTILEGMASGCPCIVPPIGGHLSYFDKDAGLICDARKTSEIVSFIRCLQQDESLWRKYSDHATCVAKDYSAESYSVNVTKLLERLIN